LWVVNLTEQRRNDNVETKMIMIANVLIETLNPLKGTDLKLDDINLK
jgi:hypothetical protein